MGGGGGGGGEVGRLRYHPAPPHPYIYCNIVYYVLFG